MATSNSTQKSVKITSETPMIDYLVARPALFRTMRDIRAYSAIMEPSTGEKIYTMDPPENRNMYRFLACQNSISRGHLISAIARDGSTSYITKVTLLPMSSKLESTVTTDAAIIAEAEARGQVAYQEDLIRQGDVAFKDDLRLHQECNTRLKAHNKEKSKDAAFCNKFFATVFSADLILLVDSLLHDCKFSEAFAAIERKLLVDPVLLDSRLYSTSRSELGNPVQRVDESISEFAHRVRCSHEVLERYRLQFDPNDFIGDSDYPVINGTISPLESPPHILYDSLLNGAVSGADRHAYALTLFGEKSVPTEEKTIEFLLDRLITQKSDWLTMQQLKKDRIKPEKSRAAAANSKRRGKSNRKASDEDSSHSDSSSRSGQSINGYLHEQSKMSKWRNKTTAKTATAATTQESIPDNRRIRDLSTNICIRCGDKGHGPSWCPHLICVHCKHEAKLTADIWLDTHTTKDCPLKHSRSYAKFASFADPDSDPDRPTDFADFARVCQSMETPNIMRREHANRAKPSAPPHRQTSILLSDTDTCPAPPPTDRIARTTLQTPHGNYQSSSDEEDSDPSLILREQARVTVARSTPPLSTPTPTPSLPHRLRYFKRLVQRRLLPISTPPASQLPLVTIIESAKAPTVAVITVATAPIVTELNTAPTAAKASTATPATVAPPPLPFPEPDNAPTVAAATILFPCLINTWPSITKSLWTLFAIILLFGLFYSFPSASAQRSYLVILKLP